MLSHSSSVQQQSGPRPPMAPPMAGPTPTEPPAPPQTVATIGGQKFIVVPKHNLLAVSSPAAGVSAARAPRPRSVSPSTAPTPLGAYYVPGSGGGSDVFS